LPKEVKQSITETGIKEALKDALNELKSFDKNITQLSEDLPNDVLKSIQSSISYKKGKVGELATLMSLLGAYKRIIPLGQPVDYIGIGDSIDFIETKTGASGLTPEEKEIQEMIEQNKVRFILRRERVEITAPAEISEEIVVKK
jgi:predicted Holliday junction resolvase-like endonuclease